MPRPAAAWTDDGWDRAWAALDSRPMVAPRPRPVAAGRRRPGAVLGLVVLALGLPAAWFAGPMLLAAEVLRGLGQHDATALSARVDWVRLAPNMASALRDAAGPEHGPDARRFLDGLAQEMAAAWEQPEARDTVLAGRALPPAALQTLRVEAPDRVVLDLGAQAGLPRLRVTLSMTEPARRGWAVTGLHWPEAAAPAGTLAPPPLRAPVVAF